MMLTEVREFEVETDVSRRHSSRLQSRFLRGPIPLSDLAKAAQLPGQALALYLLIRHQVDLTANPVVTTPSNLLKLFGIDKDAKARALRSLVAAELITLEQRRGKSARIALSTYQSRKLTP